MDYYIKASESYHEKPDKDRYYMHMHDTYEIYAIYAGDADYYVEGTCYPLRHGDVMVMRKSESHQIVLKGNTPYGRMVVNFDLPFLQRLDPEGRLLALFDSRPLGRFNHYSAAMFPKNNWMDYLKKINETEDPMLRLSHLMGLLAELTECFEVLKGVEQAREPDLVTSVIYYINQHLAEKLSLSVLCDQFYLSKAHLNRIFKQSTGATIWNYIQTKRLLLSKELLSSGMTPTDVCVRTGFQDYTTFYRAYKKYFGVSPKSERKK